MQTRDGRSDLLGKRAAEDRVASEKLPGVHGYSTAVAQRSVKSQGLSEQEIQVPLALLLFHSYLSPPALTQPSSPPPTESTPFAEYGPLRPVQEIWPGHPVGANELVVR